MIAWFIVLLTASPSICAPNVGLDPRPKTPCLSPTGDVIYLPAMRFTRRFRLRPKSRSAVRAAARLIQRLPPARVEVHAHIHEPDRYSIRKGQRRARAIVDVLVEAGIRADRLKAMDWGDERPMFSNRGPNKAKNRRIEIHLRPLR
jgi:flagellar motor protein MotB